MLLPLLLAGIVTGAAWLLGARAAHASAAGAPPSPPPSHPEGGDERPAGAGLGPPSAGNTVTSLACLFGGKSRVLTGVEVLANDGYRAVRGRRVGVVTNPTGEGRRPARVASGPRVCPLPSSR